MNNAAFGKTVENVIIETLYLSQQKEEGII